MSDTTDDDVFYGRLARWWPLISPVEDYRDEATYLLTLLDGISAHRPTLLELGSGGGHVATFLAERFDLTLVDRSPSMLAMSQELHPHVAHICADMRTVRLGSQFDVVFIHDAIDYMTNEADLRAALVTVFVHLKSGGRALIVPDATREIFAPGHDVGGSDGADGRAARFLEWTTDPEPSDTVVTTDYVFLLRYGDGRTEVVHDTHHTGLFSRDTWLRLMRDVGFDATVTTEATDDDRVPRDIFVATLRVNDG